MISKKVKIIRSFFEENSNPDLVKKYARYFKEGYNGFGIDKQVFENQTEIWFEAWNKTMTIDDFLKLGNSLMQNGKFEEQSLAITFLKLERKHFTENTFEKIGDWFDYGIDNWATTDVLCMLVLSIFFEDKVIPVEKLSDWVAASSQWQRRAVPVTLVELDKKNIISVSSLTIVEPLMLDDSEYVQKGIGTLLRGLWKKQPVEVEGFLLKWKDECGRKIVQYATEKMDKEYRKKFRRNKKK